MPKRSPSAGDAPSGKELKLSPDQRRSLGISLGELNECGFSLTSATVMTPHAPLSRKATVRYVATVLPLKNVTRFRGDTMGNLSSVLSDVAAAAGFKELHFSAFRGTEAIMNLAVRADQAVEGENALEFRYRRLEDVTLYLGERFHSVASIEEVAEDLEIVFDAMGWPVPRGVRDAIAGPPSYRPPTTPARTRWNDARED